MLADSVSCIVTEERNGTFEATFTYPVSGVWYGKIEEGSIVKIKANEVSDLQLFRVYKSSKPLKGIVTYSCRHISYDLVGLPVIAYRRDNVLAGTAMSEAFAACPLDHPFSAWSDKTVLSNIDIDRPRSLRSFCGGESGSVLDVYGGEFEFDNFVVKLYKNRGADNGVVINYGKNLTDAKQEANIDNCYTHLCPYAVKTVQEISDDGTVTSSQDVVVTLPEGLIELISPASVGHKRVKIIDLSDRFGTDEPITEDAVRAYANRYIDSNDLHSPKVNITLSYMQVWDSAEFRPSAIL
ncbi:MAG: phage tail spike protein, partial [Eubacteriales bacterium]